VAQSKKVTPKVGARGNRPNNQHRKKKSKKLRVAKSRKSKGQTLPPVGRIEEKGSLGFPRGKRFYSRGGGRPWSRLGSIQKGGLERTRKS